MPDWGIAILSALVALVLRETYEWFRRPRINVNFELWKGKTPRLIDFTLGEEILGIMSKSRYLRLRASNTGRKPALDCEAKMVVYDISDGDSVVQSLHWSRRDPRMYKSLDQIYAPIHLNPKDSELIDVLKLDYEVNMDTSETMEIPENRYIETMSPYSVALDRGKTYKFEITIYASNTLSKPFVFSLFWDGTLEGINEAFTRVRGGRFDH